MTDQKNNKYKFIGYPTIIKNYIIKNKLQNNIFYTGLVPLDTYNEIICGCDIGLQIRPGNGGAISGSVIDCLSVDVPVITVKDIIDSLDINHQMLIGFDYTKYDDWTTVYPWDGYSDKLARDIGDTILTFIANKKKVTIDNCNGMVSDIVNYRFENYAKELINLLSLKFDHKIAFVTSYPPDFNGVADFTYATIQELYKYIKNIDIFTDANISNNSDKNIYKMDEIQSKFKDYKYVIYAVGNSFFNSKIVTYLSKLGGVCILHDERLCHLYQHLKKLPPNFVIDDVKGHTSPYFDEIIHIANPFIVHSKKLQGIIENLYNKKAEYIPFCSYNKLRKFNPKEVEQIRMKYGINGDINIAVNGRLKFAFQSVKVVEYLKALNINCKVFFIGP
jgi:hypothetical protein